MRNLIEKLEGQVSEARQSGQYFVLVDVGVPGGKMLSRELYPKSQLAKLDKMVASYQKKGKNVQVLDALWYKPAAELMKAIGMGVE